MHGGSFENERVLGRAGTVWRSPRMVDATESSAKLRDVAKRMREKRIALGVWCPRRKRVGGKSGQRCTVGIFHDKFERPDSQGHPVYYL